MATANFSNRVSRILSGSFNALVKAIEESSPQMVMEQTITEMDSAINDIRDELGKTVASRHLANKQLESETEQHKSLAEQISIAIEAQRDDLAEAAISKQLDIEAQIPVLENSITDFDASIAELENYISALQAKKREMRENLRQFIAHEKDKKSASSDPSGNGKFASGTVSAETFKKVELANETFERMMETTTGVPSSGNNENLETEAKLQELDNLSRSKEISDRLAKLKATN